nr:DUF1287 domain-containing protein [uncultured Carboxylicivirga sp.]
MIRYVLLFVLLFSLSSIKSQNNFFSQLADSALVLTQKHVVYDPSYFSIPYPNGDIPTGKGVCTDVIIRSYRMLGIDLQKEVHEDMKVHFELYPKIWGLTSTDKNIDHRRVPNLMTFFGRFGDELTKIHNPADYKPGDIVCWNLGGNITHIGIVSAIKSGDEKRYQIIHNIGAGQVLEDCLFSYVIIGHYRYQK